jgi:RecA-family ATPase
MVYEFVSALRKWGEDTQTTTLMIGHFPKSTAQGKYSGSTAWPASVRSMWALDTNTGTVQKTKTDKKKGKDNEGNPEAKEYYSLTHEKANYSPSQAEVFLKKEENGLWTEVATTEEATQAYQDYQAYLKSQKSNDTDYAEYGINKPDESEENKEEPDDDPF